MENLWIWLIPIGGLVVIGFVVYWRQRTTVQPSKAPDEKKGAPKPSVLAGVAEEKVSEETSVSTPQPPTVPDNPEGTPWRVLVVDDMAIWANTIRHFSSLFNCEVRHASRLTAAVQELTRWKPQLIILDLHMPRDPWQPIPALQGKYAPDQKTLAFCEQVTTHPKLAHVLVTITSVEQQPEQQANAMSAGAHYFFTKGDFDVDKFTSLLVEVSQRNPQVV
jgi:CheY-like chemotaxis protein